MMRRRIKRTSHKYVGSVLFSILLTSAVFLLVYFTKFKQMREEYQSNVNSLKEQLDAKKVYIYEAKVDIPAGSQIKEEDLLYYLSYSDKPQNYFMSKEDIGMTSLINIKAGTQIIAGMLTDNTVDPRLREVEYNAFYINTNIIQNDYIDVRIRFPNGEDYIVLSKKRILSPNIETYQCFLWLKEEEIISMSSAIVDAYIYEGSFLYTTKYIDPDLQEGSEPTYEPNLSTLAMIEQDENIVEQASRELNKRLRKAMENRLAEYLNSDVSKIDWRISKDTGQEMKLQKESTIYKNLSPVERSLEQNENMITNTYEDQEGENIIYGG